jgi:phosphate transport system ATP-binding protein
MIAAPMPQPEVVEPLDPGAPVLLDTEGEPLPLAMEAKNLSMWYGSKRAIDNVSLDMPAKAVTAIIGPSGCGKSTFIRALNRMHELAPHARIEGSVFLHGQNLYANGVDPAIVRRRVGMVFQKSNPFPTMSIGENVIVGLRLNGVSDRKFLNERLEQSLRMAALDPIATAKIEELIQGLKKQYTIVIVTHNMQQAGRVSDFTAFFYMGRLIEVGSTTKIFTNPTEKQTEDYITGRFG